MAYPEDYPDTLEKAVADGYSWRYMHIAAGPDGVPLTLGAGGGVPVSIVGAAGDVTLTGDVIVDTLGALTDDAEVDPAAASATIPSLLRGSLTQQLAIKTSVAALGALTDAAVVDPDLASASVPSLLRGSLTQQLAILAKLSADPATETTVAAVLAKLSADPSTETTLAALLAAAATETTVAAILAKISADPATETTLAAALAKLSADPSTETTLALVESYTSRLLSSATNIAAGSALATTSLVVGSRYNATPPTFTDGQEGALQIDAAGRLLVKSELADVATETSLAALLAAAATETSLAAVSASIGAVGDAAWSGTGDATVISLLKKIALNTTPP